MALVGQPQVVILDELTTGLDAQAGAMSEASTLVVLVAYIVALGWLATRLFRWD